MVLDASNRDSFEPDRPGPYEDHVRWVNEFRTFTAGVVRQYVDQSGRPNQFVGDLEEKLAKLLAILHLYHTEPIRELFTRAFRLLLLRPLPSKLSQQAFKGFLMAMLENIKLIVCLPDDKSSSFSMVRNMELSLKVINRLAKQYTEMPENQHRKYANHRNHFIHKFLPNALHRIVDLLYLDLKLAPVKVVLRVMPEIIKFLTIVESIDDLSRHISCIGFKMIRLGLIPIGAIYRNYCIEVSVNHSGQTEYRILTRLSTYNSMKRLIFNIWTNHLEDYERKQVLVDYDEFEPPRGLLDTRRPKTTSFKVDLPSSMDCLSLIIRAYPQFINDFRTKLLGQILKFDFNIHKMIDELSQKRFRLNICRVIGSLSIPLFGNAKPAKFHEYTFGHQNCKSSEIYKHDNDGYNDRWIETSLCLLSILNEQPRRTDNNGERNYLVPDCDIERFASIQGMKVIQKLFRYCPTQMNWFAHDVFNLTYTEFKKTELTHDTQDEQFWFRLETIRTMNVALWNLFRENYPPGAIDLSKPREMIGDILKSSTSNILRDEAIDLLILIKFNVDENWDDHMSDRPEIARMYVQCRLKELEELDYLSSLV